MKVSRERIGGVSFSTLSIGGKGNSAHSFHPYLASIQNSRVGYFVSEARTRWSGATRKLRTLMGKDPAEALQRARMDTE